jgi:hypothetical protein
MAETAAASLFKIQNNSRKQQFKNETNENKKFNNK